MNLRIFLLTLLFSLVAIRAGDVSAFNSNSNSNFNSRLNSNSILNSNSNSNSDIIGVWHFVGHVYHGELMPPLNDKLVLTFQFLEDGTNILKWYRTGESGFCERTANYEYDGKMLVQEVIAVNPNNTLECGRDSDMQLGTRSTSPFYKNGKQMYLELPLGDESLIYIWERSLIESSMPISAAIDRKIKIPLF